MEMNRSAGRVEKKRILYLLKCNDQYIYKIGVSRDLNSFIARFNDVRNMCPYKIENIIMYADRYDARKLEREFKKEYKEYKMRGEWFCISNEIIKRINGKNIFTRTTMTEIKILAEEEKKSFRFMPNHHFVE